jgi:hypothetical protein
MGTSSYWLIYDSTMSKLSLRSGGRAAAARGANRPSVTGPNRAILAGTMPRLSARGEPLNPQVTERVLGKDGKAYIVSTMRYRRSGSEEMGEGSH